MSVREYYDQSQPGAQREEHDYRRPQYQTDQAPSLPPLQYSTLSMDARDHTASPISPSYDSTPLYKPRSGDSETRYYGADSGGYGVSDRSNEYFESESLGCQSKPKRQHSDEIPLRDNPQHTSDDKTAQSKTLYAQEEGLSQAQRDERRHRKRPREVERKKKKSFWLRTTWVVYIMSLIQCSVFIAELVRNSILTSSPIEIHPQFNPMIGPSFYVLVNMGARYLPCMKKPSNQDLVNEHWPCPNLTSLTPSAPGNEVNCTLSEFCGFADFGKEPNQKWRFVAPIFLHAGLIHIGFNMLLQLTLGREMERTIGSIRFFVVYMSSGIFGFVLGGNYAAEGIASTGASGALFGMIAINLLDLLYTWNERVSPKKELAFIILDIVVSFVLGLLPGLDNFSHIGGFLMGLVLGVCILHSPNLLRRERVRAEPETLANDTVNKKPKRARARRVSYKNFFKDPIGFFKDRKLLWWSWWLVRAAALIGVLSAFIVLIQNFDRNHPPCKWCKYLTCIDVNNWCDQGKLEPQ